jgi:hypothetical protein
MKYLKYIYNYINEVFNTNTSYVESITSNRIVYVFIYENNKYKIYFNRIKEGYEHYHLSFCKVLQDGKESYLLLNDTKSAIKILSNVKNVVEQFIISNKVDLLIYESYDEERGYIYLRFAQNLLSLFNKYETFQYKDVMVYISSNNGVDSSYYFNNIENNSKKFFKPRY